MTNEEYLNEILKSQTLANDGDELKLLRQRRTDVEKLLREKYGSSPSIRYGGSKAKGTMIKDSYDLDVICYFDNDDGTAGDTLQEIYDDVAETFEGDYYLERKPSAIRLKCKASDEIEDYHIDVVPGRYVDDDRDDVFLYRHSGEKGRQKTNLNVHIGHVKDSGAIPAIRLGKLWRVRNKMAVRNFILELLTIELLKDKKNKSLTDQLIHLLTQLRDNIDDITIEDPANPTGNDLSELFNTAIKFELSDAARFALEFVDDDNWTAILGEVPESKSQSASAGHSNGTSSGPRIFVPRPAFGGE
ncbi:MAG: nucleotidyltransferase domain-containing protein [Acidobacteriota bacterium]|nr:MAG: nucleotidyltransferase domain-containing protein [Acidobacteriota bacterium]